MNFNLLTISLSFLLLASILGYPTNAKSMVQPTQNTEDLRFHVEELENDILSFAEEIENNNNYTCNIYTQPFSMFYNNDFTPFKDEHQTNQFGDITQQDIDALRALFDLYQYIWLSCLSNSDTISDQQELHFKISEDSRNFTIGILRSHGVTETDLQTMYEIYRFQQTINRSDNMICRQSIHFSFLHLIGRYSLKSMLLMNREERNSMLEERAQSDLDTIKAEWRYCIRIEY